MSIKTDDQTLNSDVIFEQVELPKDLVMAISKLEEIEQIIILRGIGLSGEQPESYAEIAKDLNISNDEVEKIKATAIEQLRKNPNIGEALVAYIK
jgi:DNA-directed RNA polymerase sigma subunit (sigma70/sigma32)